MNSLYAISPMTEICTSQSSANVCYVTVQHYINSVCVEPDI